MPNLHSLLGGLIPGYDRLYHRILDAEAKQRQRVEEREHETVLRSCQHRAERASAERVAFESERDTELYKDAAGSASDKALTLVGDDCELERTLVERAGLRRLRESISIADLSQGGVGQALSQALARPSPSRHASALPHSSSETGTGAGSGGGVDSPAVAVAITADDVDRLAIRFVTRMSTTTDAAQRDVLFTEWRAELRRQLPPWQADEVEQRARELLNVVC